MATIRRYRVQWNGLTGLPGYSLFYAPAGAAAGADLKTFFTALTNKAPAPCSWTIPTSGDELDDNTGTITGTWTDAGGGTVGPSSSNVAYAAGTGAYVTWNTAAIVNGRRLKGRTFFCPIITTEYDTAGTLGASMQTTLASAAGNLAASTNIVIWHRPPPGGAGGSSSVVVSALVPDKVTSLRSRRV